MATVEGMKTHTDHATVYWSDKPTERDKTGCDGLYVKSVVFHPWYKWPVRDWIVGIALAVIARRKKTEKNLYTDRREG